MSRTLRCVRVEINYCDLNQRETNYVPMWPNMDLKERVVKKREKMIYHLTDWSWMFAMGILLEIILKKKKKNKNGVKNVWDFRVHHTCRSFCVYASNLIITALVYICATLEEYRRKVSQWNELKTSWIRRTNRDIMVMNDGKTKFVTHTHTSRVRSVEYVQERRIVRIYWNKWLRLSEFSR